MSNTPAQPQQQPTPANADALAAQLTASDTPPTPTNAQLEAALEKLDASANNPALIVDNAPATDAPVPVLDAPATETDDDDTDDSAARIVPAKRFRGLQREYARLQTEHAARVAEIAELRTQLTVAHKRAADERLQYLRTAYADSDDVIADVLSGETIEDVEKSFEVAKSLGAKYRAAIASRAARSSPSANGNGTAPTGKKRNTKTQPSDADLERALARLDGRA